jgi:hypothetical protein
MAFPEVGGPPGPVERLPVLPCGNWTQRHKEARKHMTTKLDRPLKREILVDDKPYTLTIDANGMKLVEKGRRNGHEVSWKQILTAGGAAAAGSSLG